MKPVKLNIDGETCGKFRDGKAVWKTETLFRLAEDLEPFDLPLCAIYVGEAVWETEAMSIKVFAKHWALASRADLKYPVIMSDEGFIMDGWHRVAKALFMGMTTIKAVRFDTTPEPDYYRD